MSLDKPTIAAYGVWACFIALLLIILMIFYYPAGQAYAQCEKNQPLIQTYENCYKNNSVFTYQCLSREAYSRYGSFNYPSLNVTVTT